MILSFLYRFDWLALANSEVLISIGSLSTFRAVMLLVRASSSLFISPEDFNLFHAMDRELYTLLITDLLRDPLDSMQIMALWLWLERQGNRNNVIKRILSLPHVFINELADEAVTCLKCISNTQFLLSSKHKEIPLTKSLMKKQISLQYFHENQLIVMSEVAKIVTEVCMKAFTDILQEAMRKNAAQNSAESQMMMSPAVDQSLIYGFSQLAVGVDISQGRTHFNEVPPDDRTMFVTFSKGYPVAEWAVRDFFTRMFGDCIESVHMQEVKPEEQSLYARIVFYTPSIIELVLDGMIKAKFTINGKHVWMRKFVPKHSTSSPLLLLPEDLPGSV
ncbi:unnamed protein product [Ilex paraguariensis]|uniref:Uncharacterized protein n=1 Tax=Ilex paraguariensis TaxID=185542 RepID=A0ABC8RKV4_9AQUA